MKSSFLLTFFKNHSGHWLERFEHTQDEIAQYITNYKCFVDVKCWDCNVTIQIDSVPLTKFYINV